MREAHQMYLLENFDYEDIIEENWNRWISDFSDDNLFEEITYEEDFETYIQEID